MPEQTNNLTVEQADKEHDEDKAPIEAEASVIVSHVADFYRRYLGESVVFHTRLQFIERVSSFTLKVTLPPEITFTASYAPIELGDSIPWLDEGQDEGKPTVVSWDVAHCQAGSCLDYEVEGQIGHIQEDLFLESVATVSLINSNEETPSVSASATIQVESKSGYLRYLPGIYQEDEFMARFLMLFESFWKPLERQIDHIPFYFDPETTPPSLLSWLASVLNLPLNPYWPEERKRKLIKNAIRLYRKRGTKSGLKEYLEICTGGKVKITEHYEQSMILDPETRLGRGIALGKDYQSYTFSVLLYSLPSTTTDSPDFDREEYTRRIHAMIDMQCPAHTTYSLQIRFEQEKV